MKLFFNFINRITGRFLSFDGIIRKRIIKFFALILSFVMFFSPSSEGLSYMISSALSYTEHHVELENKTIKICTDGEYEEKFVTLDGMMPKNASAEIVSVADSFAKKGGDSVSEKSVVAAYDITITYGNNKEFQPGKDQVRKEL